MPDLHFDTAKEAVEVLTAHGFRVIREEVDPLHFDCAYVDLKRGKVLVRIARERGGHFIELSSKVDPSEWFDAALVLRFLNIREVHPYRVEPSAVAELARHVVGAFDRIETVFSRKEWKHTVDELEELSKRRWQERLDSRLS